MHDAMLNDSGWLPGEQSGFVSDELRASPGSLSRSRIALQARDGFPLEVMRIRAGAAPRGPIVLQHGLGSNGSVFDVPNRSLAARLAREGYDCFIPRLRNASRFSPRLRNASRFSPRLRNASRFSPRLRNADRASAIHGLDDYLDADLPAVLECVQRTSNCERVRFIGHSLGGILLMLYAIEHPDAPIERFVAVGSSLDYRPGHSVYRDLRRLRFAARFLPRIPFGAIARANALIAGRGPALPPETMNFFRSNIEPELIRAILRDGFTSIPTRLLLDLDRVFDDRGLSRRAGSLAYVELAERFTVPSCLIVGSRDAQCCEEAVRATARLLRNAPELRVACFGKAHGHGDDYGHFDLIIGARAPREVWPTMLEFLA